MRQCSALWQALKKARRFEVQKLARREKEAAGDAAAASKLALQVAAAKQADLADLAQQVFLLLPLKSAYIGKMQT